MSGIKRKGGNNEEEDAKHRKLFEFLAPPSPSTSVQSPVSPSTSVPSPASPSTSVPSPASPSTSVPSPVSPSPVSTPNLKLVCTFCDPPQTFNTERARQTHEQQHHSEDKGLYAPPMIQDRSDTELLFNRYAPVLPNGFTTIRNPLGIYIKNANGELAGAFHKIIAYKGVSPGEAERIRCASKRLFPASGFAQGHIIPGSSARDHPSMYALSYDEDNFEPQHPQANSNLGEKIEDYCQLLRAYGWNVFVFILLDKSDVLGTIKATNGRTYTISANWSYLIFMQRLNEHFYQAFSFPNAQPTKTYWEYRTTIDAIRSLSGIDFQFKMSESIVQYSARIKQEKYVRDNPFPCTHLGCSKRYPTAESLRLHQYEHNPKRKEQKKAANAKRHAASRTSVTPNSPSSDNSS